MSRRYDERTILTGAGLDARVSHMGQRAIIKSVQTNSGDLNGVASKAVTLATTVDINNSVTFYNGVNTPSNALNNDASELCFSCALTNGTTVTVYNTGTSTPGVSCLVSFTVLEFFPGVLKSVQRGIGALVGAASGTTTLNPAVNTSKAIVNFLGNTTTFITSAGSLFANRFTCSVTLTNSTTLTYATSNGEANRAISWEVWEFF